MNKPVLSSRMATAAVLVPSKGIVADIGTDHGKLAVWLAAEGRKVIATDMSEPSLRKAMKLAGQFGVSLDCRLGNGMEPLAVGEANTLIMAGMGAMTMVDILSKAPEKTNTLDSLVLQPMNAVHKVRRWLCGHGFGIVDEAYALERHGIHPVFRAQRGKQDPEEQFDFLIGNWKLAARHPLFEAYLRQQLKRCQDQLKGARRGGGEAAAHRSVQLESELTIYEGAMAWFVQQRQS